MPSPDQLCVVGLWHLGSVIAACWAELGHRVVGLEFDRALAARLQSGRAPIDEPGLDDLIQRNLRLGRLRFTSVVDQAVPQAQFAFLAFDTPVDAGDSSDLGPLERALASMTPHLDPGAVVVVSSQVPVGTCRRWRREIRAACPHNSVDLVYSPENLRLGEAIDCYLHPDRIVVGTEDEQVGQRIADLFAPMGAPVLRMTLESAEMAKHALNGFLATSVSFVNEIATLCEITGADVLPVAEALRSDPRIGRRAFLSPGLGFAGGTLARDLRVMKAIGIQAHTPTPMLDAVLEVNSSRPGLVLRRLTEVFGSIDGLIVGVLGLTYKAGTSTLRRSVALDVIALLLNAGVRVKAFDPKADLSEFDGPAKFQMVSDAYAAAQDTSALVVLTEWPEFRQLDFARVRGLMAKPVILDGKNLLADLGLAARGFRYLGVGR